MKTSELLRLAEKMEAKLAIEHRSHKSPQVSKDDPQVYRIDFAGYQKVKNNSKAIRGYANELMELENNKAFPSVAQGIVRDIEYHLAIIIRELSQA
jgi:hypothetical protein